MLSDLEISSKIPIKERGSFMFPSTHLDKHIHWTRRTYHSFPSCSDIVLLPAQITWFQKLVCCKLTRQAGDQFLPEVAGKGPVVALSRSRNGPVCPAGSWGLTPLHLQRAAPSTAAAFREPWIRSCSIGSCLGISACLGQGMPLIQGVVLCEGDWLLCPLSLKGGCLVYSSALGSLWLSAVKCLPWWWWLLSPRNFLCIWSHTKGKGVNHNA